jgi:hypothetical protein
MPIELFSKGFTSATADFRPERTTIIKQDMIFT